jgi:hypothetical protein
MPVTIRLPRLPRFRLPRLPRLPRLSPTQVLVGLCVVALVLVILRWSLRRREGWEFAKPGIKKISDTHKKQIQDRCRMGLAWKDIMADPSFAHLSKYDGKAAFNICQTQRDIIRDKGLPKAPTAKCKHGYCSSLSIGQGRPCLNNPKTRMGKPPKCCKPNLKDCRYDVQTQQDRDWATAAIGQAFGISPQQPANSPPVAANSSPAPFIVGTGSGKRNWNHLPGTVTNRAVVTPKYPDCKYYTQSYNLKKGDWECFPNFHKVVKGQPGVPGNVECSSSPWCAKFAQIVFNGAATAATAGDGNKVIVYKHPDKSGDAQTDQFDTPYVVHDLGQAGWSDTISAVYVPPGRTVILYADYKDNSAKQILQPGFTNLSTFHMNDRASALQTTIIGDTRDLARFPGSATSTDAASAKDIARSRKLSSATGGVRGV